MAQVGTAGSFSADKAQLFSLMKRGRRRMRLQRGLERLITGSIGLVTALLVVLWLWRMRWVGSETALYAGALLLVSLLAWCLRAMARRIPVELVASRIDRASNLADRLGSACAFVDGEEQGLSADARSFRLAACA